MKRLRIYREKNMLFHNYIGIVAVITGLFLGAYPSGVEPTNIYRYLSWRSYGFWHDIGAFLLLYGIFSCKSLQSILSANTFRKLGEISYSVYLIHIPLLFSISTSVFLLIYRYTGYIGAVVITGIISIAVLLVASKLYHKIVEERAEVYSKKLINMFVEI